MHQLRSKVEEDIKMRVRNPFDLFELLITKYPKFF